jgi:hypothetical protein
VIWPHPKYRLDKPNDIVHTYLPELPGWASDVTVVVTGLLLFMYRKRVKVDKLLGMLFMFYTVRLIFIMSTTLPRVNGRNDCENADGVFKLGDCTDYFFSGHTLLNLVVSYNIGAPVFPLWPMVTSMITAASREHYTIDVLMPWVMLGLATAPALR